MSDPRLQNRRTFTPDSPPAPGSLLEGMLSIEMGSVPRRIWVGVNTTGPNSDPAGALLLVPSAIDTGSTAPSNPIEGQLWFDGTNLNVWDGSGWVVVGGGGGGAAVTVSDTAPATPAVGDLWYDTVNNVLNVWDGTVWQPPIALDATEIPLNPAVDGWNTVQEAVEGLETAVGAAGNANITVSDTAPPSPADGDLWFDTANDTLMVWDGTEWLPSSSGGGATVSDTAPANPNEGDLWWDTVSGQLFVFYTDATGSQWVIANSVTDSGEPPPPAAPPAFVSDAPPDNPEEGWLWWDVIGAQLYIWTGAQWVVVVNQPTGGDGDGDGSLGPPFFGVTDGSNAAPGEVGEFIRVAGSDVVPPSPSTTWSTDVSVNPQITAGDWDINAWCSLPGTGANPGLPSIFFQVNAMGVTPSGSFDFSDAWDCAPIVEFGPGAFRWFGRAAFRVNSASSFTLSITLSFGQSVSAEGAAIFWALQARRMR